MPATAICWSTYEFFKFILSSENNDRYRSSVLANSTSVDKLLEKKRNPQPDDQMKKSTHVRYVIPKPPVISTEILADEPSSIHHSSKPEIGGSQYIPASSRELPSISGVGVYTAINMNPIHTERVFDPSMRSCSR